MKNYMLKCWIAIKTIDTAYRQETFYFDTEKEMVEFVREGYKKLGFEDAPCRIRVESAFKLEKLDNNIFKSRK